MPYTTVSLGLELQVPQDSTRNWGNTFLTEFAQPISAHDHTGSGNGIKIARDAISPEQYGTWVPVYTTTNGLVVTSTSLSYARYQQVGKRVDFQFKDQVTLSGLAYNVVLFSLPVTAKVADVPFSAVVIDSVYLDPIVGVLNTTALGAFIRTTGNFALAAGVILHGSGSYEAA